MTTHRFAVPGARRPVALGALAASLAAAVALPSANAATGAATTLHLVARSQNAIGFFPHHRPVAGDRFGFGDAISGDAVGYDRGVCTLMGRKGFPGLCTVQVQLKRGTLSLQGLIPERTRNTPVAIVGGTGAYAGARGTAVVTQVSSNTNRIDVTLLP